MSRNVRFLCLCLCSLLAPLVCVIFSCVKIYLNHDEFFNVLTRLLIRSFYSRNFSMLHDCPSWWHDTADCFELCDVALCFSDIAVSWWSLCARWPLVWTTWKMSGILTDIREMSGILLKVREVSGKTLVWSGKVA